MLFSVIRQPNKPHVLWPSVSILYVAVHRLKGKHLHGGSQPLSSPLQLEISLYFNGQQGQLLCRGGGRGLREELFPDSTHFSCNCHILSAVAKVTAVGKGEEGDQEVLSG